MMFFFPQQAAFLRASSEAGGVVVPPSRSFIGQGRTYVEAGVVLVRMNARLEEKRIIFRNRVDQGGRGKSRLLSMMSTIPLTSSPFLRFVTSSRRSCSQSAH